MVVHNPNNWHWIDKNCLPWSKEYFKNEITNTTYEDEEIKVVLTEIDSVTGDCDVTQRKGKVLCIYDMKLQFTLSADTKNDEETSKITITIPEFFHDQDDDEYVFEISDSQHKTVIRKAFVPVLKAKLVKFQGDLISAHEKDVQHST
ncbi:activator of Hsp90 ATPase [Suhomyces tanzawaensis NRRL Y-17324]|uniref:Activator of Hsp90 ATPase n=1 Tax=Suhomyces tanzawaensis NRRL Y-17324 TaxID=984487 RepID=A0A1E4SQV4_9ASCO|nr:activator of Hsp90 ATPase [Suhomyces tanzawaensis NRRL Y-17324]ODV81875.1 activator of Hsp90 ATPase [Suhomyces tanzawaensis NRRL Y-17324]